MMIKLKPTVEILDEIPYILLIPKYQGGYNNLYLYDLRLFLEQKFGIKDIGLQSPFEFKVEEHNFIVGLKRNAKDQEFCALKILFKSFLDKDLDYKLEVLQALKNKYSLELFDGKDHKHLNVSLFGLKEQIRNMQEEKKEEFISVLPPAYSLN